MEHSKRFLTKEEVAAVQAALGGSSQYDLELSALEAQGHIWFEVGGVPLFIRSTRNNGLPQRNVNGIRIDGSSRVYQWPAGEELMVFVLMVNYAQLSDDDEGPFGCAICKYYPVETQDRYRVPIEHAALSAIEFLGVSDGAILGPVRAIQKDGSLASTYISAEVLCKVHRIELAHLQQALCRELPKLFGSTQQKEPS